MARVLAAQLTKSLGQSVIVENKPGGSTVTGTAALAQAEPDGYTVGMVFDSLAINAVLGTQVTYDPEKDFVADHQSRLCAARFYRQHRARSDEDAFGR